MTNPEILALIPARGGSKGIPRKNIRLFAGYPLIAYTIAAALQAETVTRIIVSTEDEEIAEVARKYGADTPFMRPVELAADQTTDLPVFQHALNWLAEHENYHPEIVLHLHATSPFRPLGFVDRAVRLLQDDPDAECVRSVVSPGQNPYKMWRIDAQSGRLLSLITVQGIDEPYNYPRQSLPAVYLQTGHANAIRPATILGGSMTGKAILPLIIDARYDVDMDTIADWERGEWVMAQGSLEMIQPKENN